MKNQIKLTAIVFAALFVMFSCEKEEFKTNTYTKKQSALTDLFKNIAPPMQSFTIIAGQQQVVVGEKGTKITFFINSFKKKDGTILTSGNVKIVLQEMLTGSEMILANKTTTSDGKLLQSGGQIYIKAYIGNEELLVNQVAKPQVDILVNNQGAMGLFKGMVKENDSIKGDTIINWEKDKDSVKIKNDSAQGGGGAGGGLKAYYNFDFGDFGYWNCDQLYSDPNPKTELYIKTPLGFVDSNTQIYIYFNSINSVAKCEGFKISTNEFFLNHSLAPIGMNIKIVMISKKDGIHYLDIKSATTSLGFNMTMAPTISSEAAIKLAIKSL
jgi:hypothetical protein